jgi:hypothetical protein
VTGRDHWELIRRRFISAIEVAFERIPKTEVEDNELLTSRYLVVLDLIREHFGWCSPWLERFQSFRWHWGHPFFRRHDLDKNHLREPWKDFKELFAKWLSALRTEVELLEGLPKRIDTPNKGARAALCLGADPLTNKSGRALMKLLGLNPVLIPWADDDVAVVGRLQELSKNVNSAVFLPPEETDLDPATPGRLNWRFILGWLACRCGPGRLVAVTRPLDQLIAYPQIQRVDYDPSSPAWLAETGRSLKNMGFFIEERILVDLGRSGLPKPAPKAARKPKAPPPREDDDHEESQRDEGD